MREMRGSGGPCLKDGHDFHFFQGVAYCANCPLQVSEVAFVSDENLAALLASAPDAE